MNPKNQKSLFLLQDLPIIYQINIKMAINQILFCSFFGKECGAKLICLLRKLRHIMLCRKMCFIDVIIECDY